MLFRILDAHVLGFRETLEIVSQRELGIEELGKELSRRLGMAWESPYGQPQWRANWLRSMGFVTQEGERFKLRQAGQQLLDTLPSASAIEPRTVQAKAELGMEEKAVAPITVVAMDFIPPVVAHIDGSLPEMIRWVQSTRKSGGPGGTRTYLVESHKLGKPTAYWPSQQ